MIGSSQQYFYFYTENVKLLNSDNLIQFLENCNFLKMLLQRCLAVKIKTTHSNSYLTFDMLLTYFSDSEI